MNSVVVTTQASTIEVTTEGRTSVVQVPVTAVVTAVTEGPQGAASSIAENGLPTGGDPGNVLLKTSNANYDSSWVANIDGGTFN